MKKIYFLLLLSMFMVNFTFSQMSFTTNAIKKPTFDVKGNKPMNLHKNSLDNKVFISDEANDLMIRSRNTIRRNGNAEGGIFIILGLGYGFGQTSQNLNGFVDYTSTTTSTMLPPVNSTTQKNLSLGKGLNFKAAFGYMLSPNLGFELGISYLLGGQTLATNSSYINLNDTVLDVVSKETGKEDIETTYQASMFRITPSIVIASGIQGINPYAKFGLSIGFGSFYREVSMNKTTTFTSIMVGNPVPLMDTTINSSSKMKEEYSGGIAIGMNATLGCSFTISEKMSIFAEFNLLNMSYSPDKSAITVATTDGVDMLPKYTVRDKQTNYSSTLVTNSTAIISTTVPKEALNQSFSFGSFGLNIGMKLSF